MHKRLPRKLKKIIRNVLLEGIKGQFSKRQWIKLESTLHAWSIPVKWRYENGEAKGEVVTDLEMLNYIKNSL